MLVKAARYVKRVMIGSLHRLQQLADQFWDLVCATMRFTCFSLVH